MNKPTHFLYFDEAENKWLQTNLEELAMRNEPGIYIIPVYENGENGEQCTFAEWPQRQKRYEQQKEEEQKRLARERQLKAEQDKKEAEVKNKEKAEAELRNSMPANIAALKNEFAKTGKLVRYTCRFFIVTFLLNCLGAGFLAAQFLTKDPEYSFLVGAGTGALGFILVRFIVSMWEADAEK